jgi:hypothetical protein
MDTTKLARKLRMMAALFLIGLAFTDVFEFLCLRNQDRSTNHSPYALEFAAYAVCVAIGVLDLSSIRRLLRKPIVWWSLGAVALFTWGMFVRSLNSPGGIDQYDFVRSFGLQLNAIVFMIACVFIFDDPHVLQKTRYAVVGATCLGIALNLYEVFHPGTFSGDLGRSAGLYGNSNDSGMALVFGCLIGMTVVPRVWRELFVAAAALGVTATFSREAMLAMGVVVVGAALGKRASVARLALLGGLGIAVFAGFRVAATLRQGQILSTDNLARLSFGTGDASANDRKRVAEKLFAEFEEAPLLGHGFGTSTYWGDIESHDLYLSYLVDYGIVGIVLIPGLMFSLRRRSWEFYTFAITFCIWCLFSHYVFYDTFALIALGIQADQAAEPQDSASETSIEYRHAPSLAEPLNQVTFFSARAPNNIADGRRA